MLNNEITKEELEWQANRITQQLLSKGGKIPDNKELANDLMVVANFVNNGLARDAIYLAAQRLMDNQVVLTCPEFEGDGHRIHAEVVGSHYVKHFIKLREEGVRFRIKEIHTDQFGNKVREKVMGYKSSEAWYEENEEFLRNLHRR